jgi:hypothetical protein
VEPGKSKEGCCASGDVLGRVPSLCSGMTLSSWSIELVAFLWVLKAPLALFLALPMRWDSGLFKCLVWPFFYMC